MAYVPGPIPQEEQNAQAPVGVTTPNPLGMLPPQTTTTGGSAGQGGAGAAPASQSGVGTPTQFGSSASKLSDYLTANADQVKAMGQNVAGNLTNQYGQVQGDINAAGQGFGQQVAGGYTAPNADLVNQAAANPSEFVKTPGNVSAFQSQLNDQYTGPTSFESTEPYANVQGEVNQAVQGAGLLNSPAGLSSYLQSNVEKNATPGQNTLDTVLLQTQPEAIKAVQDAVAPFSGLTDYLSGQTTQANALIPPAQQAAAAAQAAAQQGLQTADTGLSSNVNNELANALSNVQNYNTSAQKYQQDIATDTQLVNQLQSILGQYGYTPMGATPAPPYITPGSIPSPATYALPSAANVANVATPQDYETLAALTQLSGNAPTNAPIEAATAGQAGTYNGPQGPVNIEPLANSMSDMLAYLQNPANSFQGTGNQNIDATTMALNAYVQNLRNAYQGLTGQTGQTAGGGVGIGLGGGGGGGGNQLPGGV